MATAYEQYKISEYASPEERQGILIRNLRSYEIDYPTITDHQKSHLGYLTDGSSRRRRKRAINLVGEHDPFHYKFRANGEDLHMKLRINTELFGPDFKVENFYENDEVKTEKLEEHCYLVGETLPQKYGVAISDCDGLYGVVTTNEDMLYIEPLVNDSYVDKEKLNGTGRPHLIYKHSQLSEFDQKFDSMDITRIAPANERRRAPAPKRTVHHLSHIKFINRSGRIVKLYYVDVRGRHYFATLMPGSSRRVNTFTSHRWVAMDESSEKMLLVGNKQRYTPRKNDASQRTNVAITVPRGLKLKPVTAEEIMKNIGPKYIESMTVADKSVVTFHGKERVARYVMAIMNVVAHVFKHKSLGVDINFVLVRIVLLHKDPKEVTFSTANPNKSLLTACDYMHKIRIGRSDADPKYHDHATFLTRTPFGTAAGYAPVFGMCHPVQSCTLNGEDGFPSAFIIAHEAGHSLGMEHDGESNSCASETARGSIMAPLVQSRFNRFHWSKCSQKEVRGNIRRFRCLNDKPGEEYKKGLPFLHRYPGVHYSTDDQCLFDFGAGYKFCRAFHKDPCQVLWCNMPAPYVHLCRSMRAPALNGTECGTKKWCISGRCVPRLEAIVKPKPVDGKWGKWEDWQPCSKECGVGLRSRKRKCDKPLPRYGGKDCVGKASEEEVCNIKSCPYTIPLRENEIKDQCPDIGKRDKSYWKWSFYKENEVNINCTFERDLCAWRNLVKDKRDWSSHSGRTKTARTGPSIDHTTNSSRGKYLYFEASSPAVKGDTARIGAIDVGVRRGCLSFWYHMYGNSYVGTLRVLRLNKDGTSTLWTQTGNKGDQWLQAHVDIREESLYNLVFEAERGRSYLSDIALDDITFTVGPCNKNNADQDSVNPCVVSCKTSATRMNIKMNNPVLDGVRCYDNGSLDICLEGKCRNIGCDGIMGSQKENDSCGVCDGDGSSCKRKAKMEIKTPKEDFEVFLNIPKGTSDIEVKKMKNLDHLLVLTVKDPKRSNKLSRVINGGNKESPPAIYYAGGTQYIYTSKYGEETIKSLGVVKEDVSINVKMRNKRGRRSNVVLRYEYFESLNAKHGSAGAKPPKKSPNIGKSPGPVYRWDITNDWTPCSKMCGRGISFLKYFCKRDNAIVQRSNCKHLELHVTKKYMYCNAHPCGKTFEWSTGTWSTCSKTCSLGVRTRRVTCTKQPANTIVLRTNCKTPKPSETKNCILKACPPKWRTGKWSECSSACGLGGQARSVFCVNDQGQRTNGCDMKTKPESKKNCRKPACPNRTAGPLDCDFEKNLCEWRQMTNDDFDWLRNSGKTKSSSTGPTNDHTLKKQNGHYLYIEASNRKRNSKARLVSPETNVRRGCLTFYYHMLGSNIGKLRVKFLTKAGYMDESTWTMEGEQGNKWLEARVNISIGLSYKVVIEATSGRGWRGDIAIDDIVFHQVECDSKEVKNFAAGH